MSGGFGDHVSGGFEGHVDAASADPWVLTSTAIVVTVLTTFMMTTAFTMRVVSTVRI